MQVPLQTRASEIDSARQVRTPKRSNALLASLAPGSRGTTCPTSLVVAEEQGEEGAGAREPLDLLLNAIRPASSGSLMLDPHAKRPGGRRISQVLGLHELHPPPAQRGGGYTFSAASQAKSWNHRAYKGRGSRKGSSHFRAARFAISRRVGPLRALRWRCRL